MKTASFQTYAGPGRISIARFAPRNTPAGYRQYKPLAPGPWFNSVERAEYEARFAMEILAPLDPEKTLATLQQLAGVDVEPVLLCWEVPPFDEVGQGKNWCHRRMVAAWFEKHLGMVVEELPANILPKRPTLTPQAKRLGIELPNPQLALGGEAPTGDLAAAAKANVKHRR